MVAEDAAAAARRRVLTLAGGVVALLLATVAMLAAGPRAAAQATTAELAGAVTEGDGPAAGIEVDLFTSNQAGIRVGWLRSTVTDQDGRYRFEVDPGCYAVTFIAPDGGRFENGSRWSTTATCVEAGERRDDIGATLRSVADDGVLLATVVDRAGRGVSGLLVDLFASGADGSRGRYLTSTRTEARTPDEAAADDGSARFEVGPGCYVLTAVAGDGETFEASGSRWLNIPACVGPGETVDLAPVTLLQPGGVLDVAVTEGGAAPLGGVQVDLFTVAADGGRATYLESFITVAGGRTVQPLGVDEGCRIATFIAPDRRTFADTGTRWRNHPFCVDADRPVHRVDVGLTPATDCASGAEFEVTFRDDFDGTELRPAWSPYFSAGNAGFGLRRPAAITVEDGFLRIAAAMRDGSLVSGGMSHDLDQAYGRYRFRVRTDEDPSQTMSGVVVTWPSSGIHPRDGENNIYETLVQTPTRNPFYSFVHKPFGSHSDLISFRHDADGARFQVMTMDWTPDRLTITREGPGGAQNRETFVIDETPEDLIPDVPHRFNIQLDAWQHSLDEPVTMEVDWVEISRYCG